MEKPTPSPSPSPNTSLARRHNGPIELPPGFRFHPTDEELVLHYLRRKALSCPLPASIIPELDLSKYNPWDLPGGCEHERYFFAPRRTKYAHGTRSDRLTSSGYWKATGKDRAVVASKCNQVVGMKKLLVFYRGKAPKGSRTEWIMHEYRIVNTTHSVEVPVGDWVLCRIFTKKRATNMDVDNAEHRAEEHGDTRFVNFLRQQEATSSNTSCVTEAADESSSGEDVSSATAY